MNEAHCGEGKWEKMRSEAVVQRCAVKKLLLCNFINKETLAQVFSCEFCEIFTNTYFYRTPLVAASVLYLRTCVYICVLKGKRLDSFQIRGNNIRKYIG